MKNGKNLLKILMMVLVASIFIFATKSLKLTPSEKINLRNFPEGIYLNGDKALVIGKRCSAVNGTFIQMINTDDGSIYVTFFDNNMAVWSLPIDDFIKNGSSYKNGNITFNTTNNINEIKKDNLIYTYYQGTFGNAVSYEFPIKKGSYYFESGLTGQGAEHGTIKNLYIIVNNVKINDSQTSIVPADETHVIFLRTIFTGVNLNGIPQLELQYCDDYIIENISFNDGVYYAGINQFTYSGNSITYNGYVLNIQQ